MARVCIVGKAQPVRIPDALQEYADVFDDDSARILP